MKLLSTLTLAAALAAATAAFGADMPADIHILSSADDLPLPAADGSFSDVSSRGHPVRHIYYMISEDEFYDYTSASSPSEAIYNAFLVGELGEACLTNAIITTGYSDIYLSKILDEDECPYSLYYGFGENAYFAAIYTYTNETTGAFYYIAQPTNIVTLTEEEIDALETPFGAERKINNIAIAGGRWEVIAPPPLEIRCTALSLAEGAVSATYEISDYSRMGEISSYPNVNVVASADLSRTSPTNIPATIRSASETTGGAGILTLNFPCPPNFPTLFLLGLEKP